MAAENALTPNGRLGSRKVKTGCKTCKIRRVKCDEAKPSCRRCTHSGRKCDGYSRTPQLQQQKWVDWQPKDQGQTIAIISPERAIASFVANEQELRSFDFYRDRTASSLAHTLDSSFWTEFILRVSHSEPAVRHALVAIGALNERLRPTKEDAPVPSNLDRHLKLALSSYNKSIQCLRSQMQHNQSDLIALLTCVLFICIEFLQDNITEALTLVHQGCAMLRVQEKTQEEKGSYQKSQSQQVMIDTQVMPMFTRLTVLSALCGRPASLKVPGEVVQEDAIPFVDLRGARSSLYNIMEQGHAVIRQANTHKWFQEESPELESLCSQRCKVLEQLNTWQHHFTQLQTDLEFSKSTRLIQAVSLLSMYFITTSIWITTCLERAETSYDAYQAQFGQIIEAAELFINLSKGQPQSEILFTFEMGLVPPLYFTATRCRFPEMRRQAVSLIRRAPGKEGMWDRAEMMYIASKAIAMEEGGVFDAKDVLELPREADRLHDIQFGREDALPGQRKTVVKYLSKAGGLDGPWHISKEYFD